MAREVFAVSDRVPHGTLELFASHAAARLKAQQLNRQSTLNRHMVWRGVLGGWQLVEANVGYVPPKDPLRDGGGCG